MGVHDLTIATKIYAPEVWANGVLSDGSVAGLARRVSWIAVAAIPHIERPFQKLRAGL